MTRPWMVWVRVGFVLFVGIVVQTTLMPDVQFRGVRPDLMLLIAIGAGIAGGPATGAAVGFAAGLLTDLFLQSTPLGLAALTYCLVGFSVGGLRTNFLPDLRWLAPAVAMVASGCGVVLFIAVGAMVGQRQLTVGGAHHIIRIAVIEAVLNAVFSLVVQRVTTWSLAGSRGSVALSQTGGGRVLSD